MILNTVNKSLEIVLGGAVATNQLVFSVVFMDIDQSNFKTVAWDSVDGVSNNTTAVDMVGSPASGVSRLIEEVNIHNSDTAAADVKVQINNNATLRTQVDESLSAGRTLQYTRQKGWRIVNDAGVIESVLGDATTTDPFADDTNLLGISNTGGFVKNTWAKLKSFFATLSGGNTFSGIQHINNRTDTAGDGAITIGDVDFPYWSVRQNSLRRLIIESYSSGAYGDVMVMNRGGRYVSFPNGISFDGGVNVLSQFEQVGIWTPVFEGQTTAGSYSLSNVSCFFINIGTMWYISGKFSISEVSAGSGRIVVKGFPVTLGESLTVASTILLRKAAPSMAGSPYLFCASGGTQGLGGYIGESTGAGTTLDISDFSFTGSNPVIHFQFFVSE